MTTHHDYLPHLSAWQQLLNPSCASVNPVPMKIIAHMQYVCLDMYVCVRIGGVYLCE